MGLSYNYNSVRRVQKATYGDKQGEKFAFLVNRLQVRQSYRKTAHLLAWLSVIRQASKVEWDAEMKLDETYSQKRIIRKRTDAYKSATNISTNHMFKKNVLVLSVPIELLNIQCYSESLIMCNNYLLPENSRVFYEHCCTESY